MARPHYAMGADNPKEAVMNEPQPVKDASHLYEVERRAQHTPRAPAFALRSCSSHRPRRCRGTPTPMSPILFTFWKAT